MADLLADGPVVVAMLHGDLLPLVALHRGLPLMGLVSRSSDGQLAADVAAALGFKVIRGSSSSGGLAAVRAACRAVGAGASPAIAVDGPRGPVGEPQLGALAVGRAAQARVVWARAVARPAWRLRSWDRFAVPLPFARIGLRYGELPAIGPGREGLEVAASDLRRRLSG